EPACEGGRSGALAEEEEDPERVRDRLEHADQRRARRRHEAEAGDEKQVGARQLDRAEEEEDRRRALTEREAGGHERREHAGREQVSRNERRLRAPIALAPERQD